MFESDVIHDLKNNVIDKRSPSATPQRLSLIPNTLKIGTLKQFTSSKNTGRKTLSRTKHSP